MSITETESPNWFEEKLDHEYQKSWHVQKQKSTQKFKNIMRLLHATVLEKNLWTKESDFPALVSDHAKLSQEKKILFD